MKKTVVQFFDDTITNSYKLLYKIDVNSDTVIKKFKDDIKLNYKRILDL